MFALPGRGLSPEWDSIGADLTLSRMNLTLSRVEAAFYLTLSRMELTLSRMEAAFYLTWSGASSRSNLKMLNFTHKSICGHPKETE